MDMPATTVEAAGDKAIDDRVPAASPAPRRTGRLFRKYFILILALVTSALLIPSSISLLFSYRETLTALHSVQQEKAIAAASRIEQYIVQIQNQLRGAALPQLGAEASEQRRLEFLKLLKQVPDVTDIAYIGTDGCEKTMVSRLAMDSGGECLRNRSADPAFRAPTPAQSYYSPVYFRKETEPYMQIAVRSSNAGAVTVADVNLKFMWDVITRIRIGEKGKAYVVDSNGYLIADPDIGLVLRKTDLNRLAHVHAALAAGGAAMPVAVTEDASGGEVLTAYASVEPTGWKVFVEQPAAEVTARLNDSIWRTAMLLLGGMVISALAALFLARGMARPIRTLQEGAQRIGAGELDHNIDVRTGDELEGLAGNFNRMTAQLRESYAGLERKVEARTEELQRSLEQQTAISEILRVISASPTDVQPVMNAVAERAALLCGAPYARIMLIDGAKLRPVAQYGTGALGKPGALQTVEVPLDRTSHPRAGCDRSQDRPPCRRRATARRRVSRREGQHAALRPSRRARRAVDARGRCVRWHHHRPPRPWVVSTGPGRTRRDVRAPGGDRDRQRAPVQRNTAKRWTSSAHLAKCSQRSATRSQIRRRCSMRSSKGASAFSQGPTAESCC